MHTCFFDIFIAGEAWGLGYCVPFSFFNHKLAYAAEYKMLKLNLSYILIYLMKQ